MSRYGLRIVMMRRDLPRLAAAIAIAAVLGGATNVGPAGLIAAAVCPTAAVAIRRARHWRLLARHAERTTGWDAICDVYLRDGHLSANPGGKAARIFTRHHIPDAPLCGPDFTNAGLVCMGCIDIVLHQPQAIGGPTDADPTSCTLDGVSVPADPLLLAILMANHTTPSQRG